MRHGQLLEIGRPDELLQKHGQQVDSSIFYVL